MKENCQRNSAPWTADSNTLLNYTIIIRLKKKLIQDLRLIGYTILDKMLIIDKCELLLKKEKGPNI